MNVLEIERIINKWMESKVIFTPEELVYFVTNRFANNDLNYAINYVRQNVDFSDNAIQ